jgi:hypothetical protein
VQRVQRCPGCGTHLDVSTCAPGSAVRCGSCNRAIAVDGGPPAPAVDGPRRAGSADSPLKRAARARLRASRVCATSMYACAAMVPALFLAGAIGVAVCGVISIVMGTMGLVQLGRVGKGGRREVAAGGLVRSSVRLASRAPVKAWVGIGVSVVAIAGSSILFVVALREHQRKKEQDRQMMERFLEDLQEIQRRSRQVPVDTPLEEAEESEEEEGRR